MGHMLTDEAQEVGEQCRAGGENGPKGGEEQCVSYALLFPTRYKT